MSRSEVASENSTVIFLWGEGGQGCQQMLPSDRDQSSFHCCDLKECLRTALPWVIKILLY